MIARRRPHGPLVAFQRVTAAEIGSTATAWRPRGLAAGALAWPPFLVIVWAAIPARSAPAAWQARQFVPLAADRRALTGLAAAVWLPVVAAIAASCRQPFLLPSVGRPFTSVAKREANSLMIACPQCGTSQRPDARFCTQCGAALPTSPAGPAPSVPVPLLALPAFTSAPSDWWQLGGLGLMLLSLVVPWIGLPGGVSLGPTQLGARSVILVLLILADAALLGAS